MTKFGNHFILTNKVVFLYSLDDCVYICLFHIKQEL